MEITSKTTIGELVPVGKYCALWYDKSRNMLWMGLGNGQCPFLHHSSCGWHCAIINDDCHLGHDDEGILKHSEIPYDCDLAVYRRSETGVLTRAMVHELCDPTRESALMLEENIMDLPSKTARNLSRRHNYDLSVNWLLDGKSPADRFYTLYNIRWNFPYVSCFVY